MKIPAQNKDSQQLDAVLLDTSQDSAQTESGRWVGDRTCDTAWGQATLCVDASGMSVTLKAVRKIGGELASEQVLTLLKENGIVHGIRGEALVDIESRMKSASQWRGELEVAVGTPAQASPLPSIPLLEQYGSVDLNGRVWSVGGMDIDFQRIQRLLETDVLDVIEPPYPVVWMVKPQDVLAVFEVVADGAGKDVFGDPVPVSTDTFFIAGDGVVQDGRHLKASQWGIVIFDGQCLSVVAPIWISADHMQAFYLHFPCVGTRPVLQQTWIVQALEKMGIDTGFVGSELDALVERMGSDDLPFANFIAQGSEAVAGQDARLLFEMDMSQKPGLVMPDGSIDLRERNMIHNVSADALLVRKVPATKGKSGKNLLGEVIPASDGQDVALSAGEGARLHEASYEGQVVPAVFATIDGAVVARAGQVSVNPIFRVSGDVDYETGNVEFEKDVHISGSVKTGFEVRAGGNVTIGGTIESGASVRVKGNLVVGRGILGKTTRVVVLGELRAQFIQNAMVVVAGDLWCGRYIHNAQVRCGGALKVPAGSGAKSGSVVGGLVCATKKIDVAIAGSESVGGTVLSIQADPEAQTRLEKLRNNMSICDVQISKLTRSLGVPSLNGEIIKKRVALLSGKQREHYVGMLKKLKEVSGIRQKTEIEYDQLTKKLAQMIKGSQISVSKTAFARTVIKIGERAVTLEQDVSAVTFEWVDQAIVNKVIKKGA